jgi:hypothetical protein
MPGARGISGRDYNPGQPSTSAPLLSPGFRNSIAEADQCSYATGKGIYSGSENPFRTLGVKY